MMPNESTKTFTPAEIRAQIKNLRRLAVGYGVAINFREVSGALEYLLQFVEWKQIETAPRTSPHKKILLCSPNKGWMAAEAWPLRERGSEEFTSAAGNFYPPTHWLPLPPPPQDKEPTK